VREEEAGEDQLVPVFRNGELLADWTLADIRERAAMRPRS
jgi:hypothetical protein